MIDEREVFIGCTYRHNKNWCGKRDAKDNGGTEFDFTWTPSHWYLVGECLLFLDDVSGIPLTSEILEKFSLNKVSDGVFSKGRLSFSLVKYSEGYLLDIYAGNEYLGHYKHTHQLQNLYFSLAGEELTYTP